MIEEKEVLIRIRRQKSPVENGYLDEFHLKANENSRILDLLEKIREQVDSSLSFRANCGQGSCGSDGMQINGQNRLACQTLLKDIGYPDTVVVRPLPGFKVLKDLVVDMSEMRSENQKVAPFQGCNCKNDKEHKQTPAQQEKIAAAASCIRCGCCQSACPATWEFDKFSGPAPLTLAHRYLFDSRDRLKTERIKQLKNMDLWKCFTIYNCIEVCPREINVTGLISEIKKAEIEGKAET